MTILEILQLADDSVSMDIEEASLQKVLLRVINISNKLDIDFDVSSNCLVDMGAADGMWMPDEKKIFVNDKIFEKYKTLSEFFIVLFHEIAHALVTEVLGGKLAPSEFELNVEESIVERFAYILSKEFGILTKDSTEETAKAQRRYVILYLNGIRSSLDNTRHITDDGSIIEEDEARIMFYVEEFNKQADSLLKIFMEYSK